MLVVYSKDNCSKCDQAKMLLQVKGVEYDVKMFGEDYTRDEAVKISGGKLDMPIITLDGEYLGGLNELRAYVKTI